MKVTTAHGRLAGREGNLVRVQARDDLLLAERVVLDTGTRTAYPPLQGLDRIRSVDAENWIGLDDLPRRLLILGGSYIALEMAQAFHRLGSEVVVLQQGAQLAEREDPDVSAALRQALEADGVEVRLDVQTWRIEAAGSGLRLHLADGMIEGSHLFVVIGRRPNTDDLGLETLDVHVDERGIVQVDDRLGTSAPGIWVAGDIRGGPAFTHTTYDDSGVCAPGSSAAAPTRAAASCRTRCSPILNWVVSA